MTRQHIALDFKPCFVLSNQRIAPGVHYLALEKISGFRPGQVVALAMNTGDVHRLYSLASGEGEDHYGILFDLKPGGYFTPLLSGLKKGDRIWVSQPFGTFTGFSGPAFWIATGTGIAPFISMLRSGLGEGKTLIRGGRDPESFYFSDEFLSAAGLEYTRCLSRGTAEGYFTGRLTKYLEERELPLNINYYLCGSAEMVVDVRDILINKGIPFGSIIAEIYF